MITSAVVRRYAQALHDEAGNAPPVKADVTLLQRVLSEADDLARTIASPVVPRAKKRAVLEQLFGERVHLITLRFLVMLTDRGREMLLPAILEQFAVLEDRAAGIVQTHVRSAAPLDSAERTRLAAAIEKVLGCKVRLSAQTDGALLGGIVIRIGDTVYDGSVRHQLSLLRAKLHA